MFFNHSDFVAHFEAVFKSNEKAFEEIKSTNELRFSNRVLSNQADFDAEVQAMNDKRESKAQARREEWNAYVKECEAWRKENEKVWELAKLKLEKYEKNS